MGRIGLIQPLTVTPSAGTPEATGFTPPEEVEGASGPSGPPTPRFAWRARALVLFGLGGFALVAGLLLRSSEGIILASPLLLAPASAWLLLPRASTQVHLVGSTRPAETGIELTLEVTARPPLPAGALEVEIVAPEGTDAPEGTSRRLIAGEAGELPATFALTPHRPLFVRLAPPVVRWRDPLGIAQLEIPATAEGLTLERYPPEVRRIPRMALQRTTLLPGEVRSRRQAPAGEFASIRPYAAGDPRRSLNWWATARRGRLMTNEHQAERSGELVIVVDARPCRLPERDDQDLLGVARAAALGLVRSFLREKTRVGVVVFGEFADCLPLGTGSVQAYRAERMLEKAHLAEVEAPLERLPVTMNRHFPPGTPVLMITPMADDATVAAGYHLRRRGFPCLLLCPSTTTPEKERMDLRSEDGGMALRLVRLERRKRLREAWESAPVIEWEDFTTLAPLINFLRRPPTAPTGGAHP